MQKNLEKRILKNKNIFKGLTFCVTGKIPGTKNQAEVEELIASYGGKTTQTVSPNTDYLIFGIQTAKNIKGKYPKNVQRAIDLGIKVTTYEKVLEAIRGEK